MTIKIANLISEWPAEKINLLVRWIKALGIILIVILGIGSVLSEGFVFSIFQILVFCVAYYFITIISLSMQYLLYKKIDLDKWVELHTYFYKKNHRIKVFVLATTNYYYGNFEELITKTISELDTILHSKKIFHQFSILLSLQKSGIMTENEKLIEKSRSELERLHFKNAKKEKWRVNELAFCDMMYDIVILKEVNDAINTWKPQYPGGKINILERTYFQALNEQLKGNADQAREYFEQLSKENADLYFVKEAKKELEGFGLNT